MRPATAVPPRYRCAPPAQQRSRETMDRFAQAAEELLKDRPFEAISIQDIARHAGRPVGSFYARFGSKEALIPFLYERYHESLHAVFSSRLERVDWERLDLAGTVASLVDFLLGIYDERRWLIRALVLFARTRPEALPADVVRRRTQLYDLPVAILMRHRAGIRHDDPEEAIRFGIFLVSSVAREKLLFAETPHARVTPMSRRAMRDELVHVLHSYLAVEKPR
jgi:AcrR family transcriptional regulator